MYCRHCGNEYNPMEEQARCPFCGAHADYGGPDPTPGAGPDSEPVSAPVEEVREASAWERRRFWLDLPAMLEMIRAALIEPGATFRRMNRAGDIGSPLLFAVLLGTVVSLVSLFWNFVFQGLGILQNQFAMEEYALSTGMLGVMALFSPLIVALITFISAGILHLCLMLTGGANHGFEATFRVYCYTYGATTLFQLLPCCGWLIYLVWFIVAQTIGLVAIHRTTTGRALLAVLLPLIVCFGCFTLLIGGVIFAGIASQ